MGADDTKLWWVCAIQRADTGGGDHTYPNAAVNTAGTAGSQSGVILPV